MAPVAALVAAKLAGKLPVTIALGRMDYSGRFQPFGQAEYEAEVFQNQDQMWVAEVKNAAVKYTHPSPRIITHIGMFIYDQWYTDALPNGKQFSPNDVCKFDISYPLPEFHDGVPDLPSRLPYSRNQGSS